MTFKNDPTKVGKKVEFDPACAALFPFVGEVAGWRQNDNDFLRLLDGRGNSILEFSEVEAGIFEAPKPGEGILFIQNPTDLGPAPKTAEQVTGEWSISRRTGKPLCTLTLSNEAAGEEFAVRVQPPCDPLIFEIRPGDLDDGSRRDRHPFGGRPVLALRAKARIPNGGASPRPPHPC